VVSETGEMVLAANCPACKHDYHADDSQQCPVCGASRPMVEK
jgi:rRNA maturation endonuclease Nob1